MLTMFFIEFSRGWTDFPKVRFTVVEGSTQGKLLKVSTISDYMENFSTLAYFTTLSNAIFVFTFFIGLFIKISKRSRLIVLTYMLITMTVFWTSLAPYLAWGQSTWFDYICVHEHTITPLICIAWAALANKEMVKGGYKRLFIFPVLYLIEMIVITIVAHGEVSVYPFINFTNWFALDLGTAASTTLAIVSILVASFVIWLVYWLMVKINNRLTKGKCKISNFVNINL